MSKEEDDTWLLSQTVDMLQRLIADDIIGDITHIVVMRRCRRLLKAMGVKPCTANGETSFERTWERMDGDNRMQRSTAYPTKSSSFTRPEHIRTIAEWLNGR